jgi:hypothetical protein
MRRRGGCGRGRRWGRRWGVGGGKGGWRWRHRRWERRRWSDVLLLRLRRHCVLWCRRGSVWWVHRSFPPCPSVSVSAFARRLVRIASLPALPSLRSSLSLSLPGLSGPCAVRSGRPRRREEAWLCPCCGGRGWRGVLARRRFARRYNEGEQSSQVSPAQVFVVPQEPAALSEAIHAFDGSFRRLGALADALFHYIAQPCVAPRVRPASPCRPYHRLLAAQPCRRVACPGAVGPF